MSCIGTRRMPPYLPNPFRNVKRLNYLQDARHRSGRFGVCLPATDGVNTHTVNPLALTYTQFLDLFRQRYTRGHYHAAEVYRSFFRCADPSIAALPAFADNPRLSDRIQDDWVRPMPQIEDRQDRNGVSKLLFRLSDGLGIETVVLPMPRHVTVCISCQVGCRMGCRFCETGRMGFKRDLSAAEIVAQVVYVRAVMGLPVRNVVFMGMGEPLDNADAVFQALHVLEDQRGLDITARHITLSTLGLIPGIERLAGLNRPRLSLAISLNAPTDELRRQLMPATAAYPLRALKQALLGYPLPRDGSFFVEYVLIKGINDGRDHARQVADWLKGLPVKVNLIACNPRTDAPFEAPTPADVERFRHILVAEKLFVRLRGAKGDAIQAACGQLGKAIKECV